MKKISVLMICLLMSGYLFAQGKYSVPSINTNDKHGRTLGQAWVIAAAGIQFAKEHGVSPYEYGKYMGNLFAPSWGPGNDFDGLVQGVIFNTENFRHESDKPIQIAENPDGSVIITTDRNMWSKYFDNNPWANFNEFQEFMKGIYEPIAEHMGAIVKFEVKDANMVMALKKK